MSLSFDRVAGHYDASRGGEPRGAGFADGIRPGLVGRTVLEVGVGTGVVAKALRERGFTVFGVDLAGAMLGHARRRLGPVVVRGDALRLPFAGGAVDNVVFAMALHAIGDVAGAFAEAARVVRRGGRVVATHGRPRQLSTDLDVTRVMAPLAPLRDHRPDSEAAVAAAAARAGLELVDLAWGPAAEIAESPRSLADGLERRIFSYLWDLDDATFRSAVAPVVAALRALPEPGRERAVAQSPRIATYRLEQ